MTMKRIRLNHPFTIESILDDLKDYKLNVVYDGTKFEGWLTQDFDKKSGMLQYKIFDQDGEDVNHFINMMAIRRLDIIIIQ